LIDTPAILTWPLLIAQLVIFGTATFALMFAPAALGESEAAPDIAVTLWRVLAVIILIMSPLVFMEIASAMAQESWIEVLPFVARILRETFAGRIWMWRFATVAILAIAVWIPVRANVVAIVALALSTMLIVLGSLTSHAIDKSILVVTIDAVHQAAGGLWLGALVSLLMSTRRGAAAMESVTPRVSAVCAWSVAIILISGALTAFQWLGWNLHLLFDSAYGRALMWKLALAAPVLLLGAYNRYWQVPRVAQSSVRILLTRTVTAECILLLGVVAWSAILANTPPPH
jgi:putative copper export protein